MTSPCVVRIYIFSFEFSGFQKNSFSTQQAAAEADRESRAFDPRDHTKQSFRRCAEGCVASSNASNICTFLVSRFAAHIVKKMRWTRMGLRLGRVYTFDLSPHATGKQCVDLLRRRLLTRVLSLSIRIGYTERPHAPVPAHGQ
jgi:hypothetical protein